MLLEQSGRFIIEREFSNACSPRAGYIIIFFFFFFFQRAYICNSPNDLLMTTVFSDVFAITKKSLILIQQIPFFDLRQLRGYVPLNLRLLTIMILLFVCLFVSGYDIGSGRGNWDIYIHIHNTHTMLIGFFFHPVMVFQPGKS